MSVFGHSAKREHDVAKSDTSPLQRGTRENKRGERGGWTDDGRRVVDDGSPQRRKGGTGVGDAVRGRSEWEIGVRSMEQGAMSARDGPGTARDPATEVGRQVDQWRLR